MKGRWAARMRNGLRTTRFHLIESEIEDRVIAYCGREMKRETPLGELVAAAVAVPGVRCQVCMQVPANG